jgi:DNA-binding response OmpR family regulator
LPPQPGLFDYAALIHRFKGDSLLSSGLYDEVKAILVVAAYSLARTDQDNAARLRTIATLLRHGYARVLVVDRQVPLPAAQPSLGHARMQTTDAYSKGNLSQLRTHCQCGLFGNLMKVLIIEDDTSIAINLVDYLESNGYDIDVASNGSAGLQLARAEPWDAILLDLSLPGMDGLTLCRKLREEAHRDTPVLMLTARDTLDDKLAGFVHGADDYLVKPFSLKEVGARLGAMIKRYRGEVATQELRFADVRLDLASLTVERAGRAIRLQPKCLHLLRILMQAPNRVFGRTELETEVWGDELPGSDTLRAHIYTLRKALTQPGEAELIETVHGLGYRLVAGDTDAA